MRSDPQRASHRSSSRERREPIPCVASVLALDVRAQHVAGALQPLASRRFVHLRPSRHLGDARVVEVAVQHGRAVRLRQGVYEIGEMSPARAALDDRVRRFLVTRVERLRFAVGARALGAAPVDRHAARDRAEPGP